jgi:hypothetical protein
MPALAPATRAALSALGYDDEFVLDNYRVWLGKREVQPVNGAAFASAPMDMTTATILVSQINGGPGIPRPQLLRAAVAMAAPIAIEADHSHLRIFSVDRANGLRLVEDIDIDQVETIASFRSQLGPRALFEAKLGSRQLALFPVDISLLSSARTQASDDLSVHLGSSLKAIADMVGESTTLNDAPQISRQNTLRSSRILIGALTCAYMRDKNNLGNVPTIELVRIARNRYRTYFDWLDEDPSETELLVLAIDELSQGISFRGLAPDIVTEQWERVLVDSAERKELGIHYTPPEIAALMLQALPIEEVHPDRRHVLDPTCGSGTLLLAAYDRLREVESISPFQSVQQLAEQHQQLTAQLHGFDQDPVAVQMTKLALLLHDQAGGNGWNVVLSDSLTTAGLPEASILVANPPWLFSSGRTGGDRTERANQFVNLVLNTLKPNGLLGLVLPSSWLTSMASKTTRERMSEECDLFEVWRLPETVFLSSRIAPTVVCGRKRSGDSGSSWRVFRRVVADRHELGRFYASGVATETFLTSSDSPLLTGPLTEALAAKTGMLRLGDFVVIREGSTPQKWITKGPAKKSGTHLFLKKAGSLKPFGYPPPEALVPVDFPSDFYWNTPLEIATGHKVLVSATKWIDNPWRLKVGIDTRGVIVRNSLNILLLKADLDLPADAESMLFALMALLGSGLASLWIDEHATKRTPSEDSYLTLPIPPDLDWTSLAALGKELSTKHRDVDALRRLTRQLENFVWAAYGIDEKTLVRLISRLTIKPPPEKGSRYPGFSAETEEVEFDDSPYPGETRIGAVFDVNIDGLRIWINSVTPSDGVRVPIPSRFPGSLAHPDATFETDATSMQDIHLARYWPQRESWRDDENLNEYVRA